MRLICFWENAPLGRLCGTVLSQVSFVLIPRSLTSMELTRTGVFLRGLDHYSGILFLTTNRVGSIDEAFQSRIHLLMYFPNLGLEGTEKIWANNIAKIKRERPQVKVDREELLTYARSLFQHQNQTRRAWNGREIRNAFQSALALASFDLAPDSGLRLTPSHFKKVADSSDSFENYLHETINGLSITQRGDLGGRGMNAHSIDDTENIVQDHTSSTSFPDAEQDRPLDPSENRRYPYHSIDNRRLETSMNSGFHAQLQSQQAMPSPSTPLLTANTQPVLQQMSPTWIHPMQSAVVVPAGMLWGMPAQQPWTPGFGPQYSQGPPPNAPSSGAPVRFGANGPSEPEQAHNNQYMASHAQEKRPVDRRIIGSNAPWHPPGKRLDSRYQAPPRMDDGFWGQFKRDTGDQVPAWSTRSDRPQWQEQRDLF